MNDRLGEKRLAQIEADLAEAQEGVGEQTALDLIAEVRRLRALLERLAPVADSLVVPVPDAGPDRIMGPIVAELLAEARAIRDDALAAHGL